MYGVEELPNNEIITLSILMLMSSVSLLTNLILLVAIVRKSSQKIQLYFYILLNFAIIDSLVCALTTMTLPSYTFYKGNLLYVTFGLCTLAGMPYCRTSYGIMVCLYSYIPWIILASVAYRWYILRFNHPEKKLYFAAYLFLFAGPTLFQLYCSCTMRSEIEVNNTAKFLGEIYPDWNFTGLTTFGYQMSTDWRMIWINNLVTYPGYGIIIISLILCFDSMRILRRMTTISETTKKLHRSFLQALLLQTLLLPISVFKSVWFTLNVNYFGASGVYWGHVGFIFTETIPLANSCSHLYFISSYRQFVVDIMRMCFFMPKITRQESSRQNTLTHAQQ